MIKLLENITTQVPLIDYFQDRHPRIRFFRVEQDMDRSTEEHLHPDIYQLTYFYSGSGTVHISPYDMPLEPGCFYIVKPHDLHAIMPTPGVKTSNATCRFELTGFHGPLLRPVIRMDEAGAADSEALLRKICAEVTIGEPVSLVRSGLLLTELLILLDSRCRAEIEDKTPPLVQNAVDYIGEKFRKRINIDDVARELGVSASHLSRVFRTKTDTSPLAYLQRVRLGYAMERLFTTRMKIGDVARDAGFETTKNLNMAFRRVYNMSATEFRRHHLENNPIENLKTQPKQKV